MDEQNMGDNQKMQKISNAGFWL